jgi:predicted short-subunit dehydrogenase-like oxidoreductase (DUF2520 family)
MLTINIIGCGKLGKTIGKLIIEHNAGKALGIVNSSLKSGKIASEYIGQGVAFENIHELPSADLYLITTKDDLIEEIANKLSVTNALNPGAIILHCSGSLSSDTKRS